MLQLNLLAEPAAVCVFGVIRDSGLPVIKSISEGIEYAK
jgi:hypothetical protein